MPHVQSLQTERREVSLAVSVLPFSVTDGICNARCPHIQETCRNRSLHPRGEVIYLKNAEGECRCARYHAL